MHPAYSVIFFTTLSGAGYGLLAWLALLAFFNKVPATDRTMALATLGLAFALIIAGLLCSTSHLGRPERAWRAFSQWKTSWLSREGVAAVATFVPSGLFAIGWVFLGSHSHFFAIMALATIAGALLTVYCTGMIYQSLPTIRAWCNPLVTPVYLALALASGGVLLLWLLRLFGIAPHSTALAVSALLLGALALKLSYWSGVDGAQKTWTAGSATGLGPLGKVRPLDPPHTQANYVMREMGFQVARKHAQQLRSISIATAFALPLLLTMMSLAVPASLAVVLATLAVISCAIGLFVERWLFFAEAQHVVTLYYGAETA
jgi:sulfite dehydrogenase (quinone) subunit SoeC